MAAVCGASSPNQNQRPDGLTARVCIREPGHPHVHRDRYGGTWWPYVAPGEQDQAGLSSTPHPGAGPTKEQELEHLLSQERQDHRKTMETLRQVRHELRVLRRAQTDAMGQ